MVSSEFTGFQCFFFSVFSFNYQSVLGYHGFYGEFSMFWFRLTSTLLVLSRGKQKERRGDPIGREKGPANRIGPNWFTGFYFIYIYIFLVSTAFSFSFPSPSRGRKNVADRSRARTGRLIELD